MGLITGEHVTPSGNCGHHAQYSGRKYLCGCLYLRERGERVGHRLGLEIIGSAEESTVVQRRSWSWMVTISWVPTLLPPGQ